MCGARYRTRRCLPFKLAFIFLVSPRATRGHSKLGSIKARFLSTIVLKFGERGFCLLGMSGGGDLLLKKDCSGKKNFCKWPLSHILVPRNKYIRKQLVKSGLLNSIEHSQGFKTSYCAGGHVTVWWSY